MAVKYDYERSGECTDDNTTTFKQEKSSVAELKQSSQSNMNHVIVYKTILLFAGYGCAGLICALSGSTFVHLELLFLCDTSDISFTLTLQSAGCLLGGFICILISKLSSPLPKMIVSLTLVAIVTTVSTMHSSIYWFLAFTTIQGCGLAVYNSVSQSYTIKLWRTRRLKNPILQATHAVWSLGVALGPLIIAYFLADLSQLRHLGNTNDPISTTHETNDVSFDKNQYLTTLGNLESSETDNYRYNDSSISSYNKTQVSLDTVDVSMVRYAYVVIGLPMFLPAVGFLVIHIKEQLPSYFTSPAGLSVKHEENGTSSKSKTTHKEKDDSLPSASLRRRLTLIFLVITFYVFYSCIEIIPRGFLTTFTVKLLGWTTRNSTLINSIYSGCLFAGRLLGVPLSAILRPRSVVAVNLVVVLAASLFMLLAEWRGGVLVWPAAGLLGYGVSTTFGSMILWFSESMSVSGALVALFMIATSVGGMLAPPVVGQLFDRYSPMWMVYVMLIVSIIELVLYLGLIALDVQRTKELAASTHIRHRAAALDADLIHYKPRSEHERESKQIIESQT